MPYQALIHYRLNCVNDYKIAQQWFLGSSFPREINFPFAPAKFTKTKAGLYFCSADGTYEMQMKTKAEVGHNGKVKWRPPTTFKSSCDIEVKFFPFDEQTCKLTFGSWTYNIEEVHLLLLQAIPIRC